MEGRKPTEEERNEFKKVDDRLDTVMAEDRKQALQGRKSNVRLKDKKYMTISDVDPEDAKWFKEFCDREFDGKQFWGLKVIRAVMERMDPFTKNVLSQISDLKARLDAHDAVLSQLTAPPEKPRMQIPQTQGSRRRDR